MKSEYIVKNQGDLLCQYLTAYKIMLILWALFLS